MSFLSTKNVETTDKVFISSFVSYGINKLRIVSIDVANTQESKYRITFHMETPPITQEGFKPVEGALGKVCNIGLFLDINDEISIKNISSTIGTIADKMNVREAVDAIAAADPIEYFAQLSKIICNGKHLWFVIAAREYSPGKYGLQFPKFNWCKSPEEVDEDSIIMEGNTAVSINIIKGGVMVFDSNNKYHLRKFVEPEPDKDGISFSKAVAPKPSFLP